VRLKPIAFVRLKIRLQQVETASSSESISSSTGIFVREGCHRAFACGALVLGSLCFQIGDVVDQINLSCGWFDNRSLVSCSSSSCALEHRFLQARKNAERRAPSWRPRDHSADV
jgi:hypothetical protein